MNSRNAMTLRELVPNTTLGLCRRSQHLWSRRFLNTPMFMRILLMHRSCRVIHRISAPMMCPGFGDLSMAGRVDRWVVVKTSIISLEPRQHSLKADMAILGHIIFPSKSLPTWVFSSVCNTTAKMPWISLVLQHPTNPRKRTKTVQNQHHPRNRSVSAHSFPGQIRLWSRLVLLACLHLHYEYAYLWLRHRIEQLIISNSNLTMLF